MVDKVRLYGKVINTWTRSEVRNGLEIDVTVQIEQEYTDYRLCDGTVYQKGTEDFSQDRLRTLVKKWIYIWDGEKRNNGGNRWFDCMGLIEYRKGDTKAVKELLKHRYPKAEVIELR